MEQTYVAPVQAASYVIEGATYLSHAEHFAHTGYLAVHSAEANQRESRTSASQQV